MPQDYTLPPNFPAVLAVQLAERAMLHCAERTDLELTAAAVTAEMRASMYCAEESDLEMILAQQGQVLNALFHRVIESGVNKNYFSNSSIAVALDTQRHCRQTVEAISRVWARKERKTGKQTGSSAQKSSTGPRYETPRYETIDRILDDYRGRDEEDYHGR